MAPPEKERRPLAVVESVKPRLLALMRDGIETLQPNTSWSRGMRQQSLFDGSYDWHSCVIAHFALSVEARVSGDEGLEEWLDGRLTLTALMAEAELLAGRSARQTWAAPYDEAWFLLLLAERERRSSDSGLREAREALEERLIDHLESAPFPDARSGAGFSGSYSSWLFTYLLVGLSDPVGARSTERLANVGRDKLEPSMEQLRRLDSAHPFDFLWLPAILALIERTGSSLPSLSYDPGPAVPLPDSVKVATVHPLGVVLSRLWPTAWDAGQGQEEARTLVERELGSFLAREDLWAEDFSACSHWLPQYLWLVGWFGAGCP